MATYVVAKDINNPSLLVTYLTTKAGVLVDSYDVQPNAITLTLRALDAGTQMLLDELVSTYVDKSTLNIDDALSYRYARVYKSSDQTLSTTLNSVVGITFVSANVLDTNYYDLAGDGSYIIIKKPGTYVFLAKVAAYLTGAVTKTSTLQWTFQFDTTRMGTIWSNISNCSSYTYHVGPGSMYDSTVVACTYSVSNVLGGYLRLSCKQIAGGANLSIAGDFTSMKVLCVSGLSMYEGIQTTSKVMTVAYQDVNYSSDRVANVPFVHGSSAAGVTIDNDGTIFVMSKVTFNKTSGTDTSIGSSQILYNGTNILNNHYAYSTPLYTAGHKTTLINQCTMDVHRGDVIQAQAVMVNGTNLSLSANDSSLFIFYLTAVNNVNNLYTGDVAIISLPSTPIVATAAGLTDVQFQSQTQSFPNYSLGVTFNQSKTPLIINTTGMYWVTCDLTFYNPNGVQRTVYGGISASTDGGATYIYQAGSTSTKRLSDIVGSYITMPVHHLIFLVAGNQLKIQVGSVDATDADNIQVVNNTNFTASCFLGNTNVVMNVDKSVFGENQMFTRAYDSLTVSSPSYVEKCRIVSNYLSTGTYRINILTNCIFPNTSDTFVVQIVDYVSGGPYLATRIMVNRSFDSNSTTVTLFHQLYLLEGVHNLILQFASPQGSALTIYNTNMELWRLG